MNSSAAIIDKGVRWDNLVFWVTVFLLVANQLFPPELNSVVCLAFIISWVFLSRTFFSFEAVKILLPYLFLVGIGSFSAFTNGNYSYHLLQDFWYYLKPVLYFLTGFYIAVKTRSLRFLIYALVVASCIVCIKHVSTFLINPALLSSKISEIREEAGKSIYIAPIALAFLIYGALSKEKILHINRVILALCLSLNSISILLTFSRTMLLVFAVILASLFGLFNLKGLGFWRLGLLIGAIVGFYFGATSLLSFVSTDTPIGALLLKIERAPGEVTLNEAYLDKREIFLHWRGYEATIALKQYLKGSWIQQATGQGLGRLVDLGFYTQLGENYHRFIPRIHNSYIEFLLKTGILGSTFFAIFVLRLVFFPFKDSTGIQERLLRRLVMSIGLCILLSTALVSGILNRSSFDPVMLILGISCGLVFVMNNFSGYPNEKATALQPQA
ncbi:MAG: O-antigen ligase family protein [Bacteroidia bacterium]|nr:O-antigen ligase family protein [Bacteroidia bacterium]